MLQCRRKMNSKMSKFIKEGKLMFSADFIPNTDITIKSNHYIF